MNYKIWAALVIAVFGFVAALWQIANVRGMRARGRRRNSGPDEKARLKAQRSSDVKHLTRQERKLLAESKRMLAQGKIIPAARILEQLNMPREAIQTLEDNGLVHDAAMILMRMQRSNRAGVVYARHGMWEHAAQCFKMANMPLEVAKCSRELGHMEVAGEYYEMAGRAAEAAECFEQAGSLHRAARLFGQASLPLRQIAMYQKMSASGTAAQSGEFDDQELLQMVDHLCQASVDQALATILGRRGRLPELILRLVGLNKHREAAEYLKASVSDLGPQLIAAVNYQDASAPALAELFISVASYGYAAMVYERLNAFDRAAMAFEKAGDMTRAAYCYDRAGRSAEAHMLRNKAKPSAVSPAKTLPAKVGGFVLSDVSTTNTTPNASGDDVEERTVVLNPAAPAAPAEAKPAASPVAVLRSESSVGALEKVAFSADLDAGQREKLWAIGITLNFRADDTILTYDSDPRGIYIIIRGSVSCYRKTSGKEAYVDQMGAFESFGELWLLADQPTAVRFVATKPTEIRLIDRTAFIQLLDNDGAIARKLYKRFTMRLLNRLLKVNNSNKSVVGS